MNLKTGDFRKKLGQIYCVDHIVELQILVTILLENKISDISKCRDFTNCFNLTWNLQGITKRENKKKGEIVLEYIRWKFDSNITDKVQKNVLDVISEISVVYNASRPFITKKLESFQQKKVYLELENSLYDFLNKTRIKHKISISIEEIIAESDKLKKELELNNIDHIVELQILTFVLKINNITSDKLQLIFIKCFHYPWNFQILSRDDNNTKGQMVKKWISAVESENIIEDDEVNTTMEFIFNHYNENIEVIPSYININKEINNEERNQLLDLAYNLKDLFQKNIKTA